MKKKIFTFGFINQNQICPMKTKNFFPFILMLVKWSGIAITDGRGKVGGSVLSKSKAGATVRNKVTPINRRTGAQSAVRAVFTSFSQLFRTLTDSQITAWNVAAAAGFTTTNIFGDTIKKSGSMLYNSLNVNLVIAGGTAISNPPDSADTPAGIMAISPTATAGTGPVNVNVSFVGGAVVVPAENTLVVYATPAMSNGVRFVKSQLRILTTLPAATNTSTSNLYSAYTAKYGSPLAGQNIVLAVQTINSVSGIAGTPIQSRIVIS